MTKLRLTDRAMREGSDLSEHLHVMLVMRALTQLTTARLQVHLCDDSGAKRNYVSRLLS